MNKVNPLWSTTGGRCATGLAAAAVATAWFVWPEPAVVSAGRANSEGRALEQAVGLTARPDVQDRSTLPQDGGTPASQPRSALAWPEAQPPVQASDAGVGTATATAMAMAASIAPTLRADAGGAASRTAMASTTASVSKPAYEAQIPGMFVTPVRESMSVTPPAGGPTAAAAVPTPPGVQLKVDAVTGAAELPVPVAVTVPMASPNRQ